MTAASAESIEVAGRILRKGGLVGIPTETVYGLGADATNEAAVLRSFKLKNRPSDNPLIVHIEHLDQFEWLTTHISDDARALADRFWPGPLTLVSRKNDRVPDVVSGGRDTVAVRLPAHSTCRKIIAAAGVPISAPSANPFMGLSPTRAEDIDPGLAGALDLIIDGGPCEFGLESTVVDVTCSPPRLLRPGAVSRAKLTQVCSDLVAGSGGGERRSPGQYARHYSPRTPLRIVDRLGSVDAGLVLSDPLTDRQFRMPRDPVPYGALLYSALHRLDACGYDVIFVEAPPETPDWEAVWDRLSKAAHPS